MPPTVLMIAEKPSIADSIAKALAPPGGLQTFKRKLPVHEFNGSFLNQNCLFRVSAVRGHVFSIDFAGEYQNWEKTDPVSLFRAPTVKKEASGGVIKHLKDCAVGVDYLVLWLDCDREGENICFEVIDCVKSKMKRISGKQQIYRAHFSAIAKSDIQKAMRSLGSPNENESLSVEARQELDLKIGVSFSRFQTKYFQGKYADLDSTVISYGPCQVPTLGFCVDRHDAIVNFKPQSYWKVNVGLEHGGSKIAVDWKRGRIMDQEVAVLFHTMISDRQGEGALVEDVKRSEGRTTRPGPLNTVEMLKMASKVLGMGPHETMHAAERLYLSGFLTYPRTESTQYPKSYNVQGTLCQFRYDSTYGPYVENLLAEGVGTPRSGHDAGDHPPITPVRPDDGTVEAGCARLFDMICRHFIATVSKDCVFDKVKMTVSIGDEIFTAKGRKVRRPGFQEIMLGSGTADQHLPIVSVGSRLGISSVVLQSGKTQPPPYLTESELIGLMERNGIGTDASIPTHINNICSRNYVSLQTGRTLAPTRLGIALCHGYHSIDCDLVYPRVRASIENECNRIARGEASIKDVTNHVLNIFETKFRYFRTNIHGMDGLFEAEFSPLVSAGKPFSKCGHCNRYMKIVRKKPQRLYCPTCTETFDLPQNGTVKLYKGEVCPIDGFELVYFSLGNKERAVGKSMPICPCCYNAPPFPGLKAMGCDSCLHPTCPHGLAKNAVCPCPGSGDDDHTCDGIISLDNNSRPLWKLSCNHCNVILRFDNTIHQLKVSTEKCEECGASKLETEFHKDRGPHAGTTIEACVLCDDRLIKALEVKKGRMKNIELCRGKGKKFSKRKKRKGNGYNDFFDW
eukprot:TRINITY_DN3614_c0_g1_i1.p1 TRINITY_DN3614_c0_g1~~TRINITY_DN3614_c0_g1_i1.p1  ORF type:complete len:850 (+),score=234.11 TRINITY_DN3614_c0_g1_i1:42-2591(+)